MFEIETVETEAPSDEALCQALAIAAGLPSAPTDKIREALLPKAQAVCKAIGLMPTPLRVLALEEVLREARGIRPGYYERAGELGKDALRALGCKDEYFEIECRIAWEKLNFQYTSEGSSAFKYLWRAGEKDAPDQDLGKARFWLEQFKFQVEDEFDGIYVGGEDITDAWPTAESIDEAIALVEKALEEQNGPTV